MAISPEERLQNIESVVFGGPNPKPTPLSELSSDQQISPGNYIVTKATAAAFTLPRPVPADDGKTLHVISTTAAAHTVTTATNAINGNKATATFSGAVGDYLTLIAFGGVWYTGPVVGITLS